MQPRIRMYVCPKCGDERVTILRDFGNVPPFLPCDQCDQLAVEQGSASDQTRIPQWEWFKPKPGPLGRMEPKAQTWVKDGGLLLRKIARPAPAKDEPNRYQRRRMAATKGDR